MATSIKILFPNNPAQWDVLAMNIDNDETGYFQTWFKVFITGVPIQNSQVQIGPTLADTLNNLVSSLSLHNSDAIISYQIALNESSNPEGILIEFNPPGNYTYSGVFLPTGVTISLFEFTPELPDVEVLEPLVHHDFAILIIDTYENDRVLIDELTQLNSPRIVWNGGDEITGAIDVSQLTFNMLAERNTDGQFFHLFTNDEKRYKVQLFSESPDEELTMVWQGFLLPDLYSEPYGGGPYFVDFTATDMIGTLKGVSLPPWFYNNRLPIMFLLAEILKLTGLDQPFIVAPSLIPRQEFINWQDINVPLFHYADGKSYADCYNILTDVLTANLLTISNYRGYWFIKGLTRKHEVVNEGCLKFDSAGSFTGYINVKNALRFPKKLAGTPVLKALTPYRKVNVQVDAKKASNTFSPEVVELQKGGIRNILHTSFMEPKQYFVGYFDAWEKIGPWNADIEQENNFMVNLMYGDGSYGIHVPDQETALAWSMARYYRCKERPYILPNVQYNLTLEGRVDWNIYFNSEHLWPLLEDAQNLNLSAGYAPIYAFLFEVRVGGQVIASNVPGYIYKDRFDVTESNNGVVEGAGTEPPVGSFKYVVSGKFYSPYPGYLEVRVYAPCFYNSSNAVWRIRRMMLSKLELGLVKEIDLTNENVVAKRSIDYTTEFDFDAGFTNTKNGYVQNCFGLNPASNSNFFYSLTWTPRPDQNMVQRVYYSDDLVETYGLMDVGRFKTTDWLKLFGYRRLFKNIFLENIDGSVRPFNMVACYRPDLMAYLKSTELFPELPENYAPMVPPNLAEESPKYMDVVFPVEDIENYDKWIVHGDTVQDSFKRTLAKALHFVRPETMFSLETTFFGVLFPDTLPQMRYMSLLRTFIASRREINLVDAKTVCKSTEAKYQILNDISYE